MYVPAKSSWSWLLQVNGLTVKSASHEVDIQKVGDAAWLRAGAELKSPASLTCGMLLFSGALYLFFEF